LRGSIQGHILRRTKKQLRHACSIPERNEFIVFCPLTEVQLDIYQRYLSLSRQYLNMDFNRPEALGIINNLRKICNHPYMFFAFHDDPTKQATGLRYQKEKLRANEWYIEYSKLID
jgi:SNF2 family DNA or RNA helicase